jgi:hypothetical protein
MYEIQTKDFSDTHMSFKQNTSKTDSLQSNSEYYCILGAMLDVSKEFAAFTLRALKCPGVANFLRNVGSDLSECMTPHSIITGERNSTILYSDSSPEGVVRTSSLAEKGKCN